MRLQQISIRSASCTVAMVQSQEASLFLSLSATSFCVELSLFVVGVEQKGHALQLHHRPAAGAAAWGHKLLRAGFRGQQQLLEVGAWRGPADGAIARSAPAPPFPCLGGIPPGAPHAGRRQAAH
jgi:hypothetical protein